MELKWTWRSDDPLERADRAILKAMEAGRGGWTGLTTGEPPTVTRSQLQRLIEEGRATADGRPIRAGVKLAAGAAVELRLPPPKPLELVPENRPLEVLFEDDQLLVLNKPAGLTVHPSSTQAEGTLVHALLHHVKDLSGIGGVLRPGIVHRLDKDTSGALVITKTDEAHRKLSESFSKHSIDREYWALCYGVPVPKPGEKEIRVESLIGRSPSDRKKMSMTVKDGRHAITHLKVIEEYGKAKANCFGSLVRARLETGRTHQVRVHLTGIGHSLLGDPVYGTPGKNHPKWIALPPEIRAAALAMPGQALHARVLGFDHPKTGERMRFEAEPPESFRLLLAALRRYS